MSWFSGFWKARAKAKTLYSDLTDEQVAFMMEEINTDFKEILELLMEDAIRKENYEKAENYKNIINQWR